MKFSIIKLLIIVGGIGFMTLSEPAQAKLNCEPLEGEWSGSMRGLLSGNTKMTIKNCRLRWSLPDGRINRCRFKEKNDKVEYSCSLGSKGSVSINGNKIVMKNIYTAHKHGGKYTVSVSKTGN